MAVPEAPEPEVVEPDEPEEPEPEPLEPGEPEPLELEEPKLLEPAVPGEPLEPEGEIELEPDPLGAGLFPGGVDGTGIVTWGCCPGRGNVGDSKLTGAVLEAERGSGVPRADACRGPWPPPAPRRSVVSGLVMAAAAASPAAAPCPKASAGPPSRALELTAGADRAGRCETAFPCKPGVPGSEPRPAPTPHRRCRWPGARQGRLPARRERLRPWRRIRCGRRPRYRCSDRRQSAVRRSRVAE